MGFLDRFSLSTFFLINIFLYGVVHLQKAYGIYKVFPIINDPEIQNLFNNKDSVSIFFHNTTLYAYTLFFFNCFMVVLAISVIFTHYKKLYFRNVLAILFCFISLTPIISYLAFLELPKFSTLFKLFLCSLMLSHYIYYYCYQRKNLTEPKYW
jgi:hypothetical protein